VDIADAAEQLGPSDLNSTAIYFEITNRRRAKIKAGCSDQRRSCAPERTVMDHSPLFLKSGKSLPDRESSRPVGDLHQQVLPTRLSIAK
jgi:hypothetical protein